MKAGEGKFILHKGMAVASLASLLGPRVGQGGGFVGSLWCWNG